MNKLRLFGTPCAVTFIFVSHRSIYYLIGLLLFPSLAAAAVEVLQPGEYRDNLPISGTMIEESAVRYVKCPGIFNYDFSCKEPVTVSAPVFGAAAFVEIVGNKMKLKARTGNGVVGVIANPTKKVARARAKLFSDFCITENGSVTCGGAGSLETITATVSFRVNRLGRMTTHLPATNATIAINAMIRDRITDKLVAFQELENTSVGNLLGKYKTIAKVPVPIPEINNSEMSQLRTFVAQFKRGRTYSFELSGVVTSSTPRGIVGAQSKSNFFDAVQLSGADQNGIELGEFSIDVGFPSLDTTSELNALKTLIGGLQTIVGELATQFNTSAEATSELITGLEADIVSSNDRLINLETELSDRLVEIADLTNNQEQLQSMVADLQVQVQALQQKLSDHKHTYLTGVGEGHNHREATTGPANNP